MYSTWSITELKQELRTRRLSEAGSKAGLIARLEACDIKNFLGGEEKLDDDVPVIALDKLPNCNASCNLPPLSELHIQQFSEKFQAPPKGRNLYDSSMQHGIAVPSNRRQRSDVVYSPIKEEDIMENYNDYVNNLAIGFATTGSKMPYLQLIKPANMHAIKNDHDYIESAKDSVVEDLIFKIINQVDDE